MLNSRMNTFNTERRNSHVNSRGALEKEEEKEIRRKRKRRSRRRCKKASKRESVRRPRKRCFVRFCDCMRGRVSEELIVCECASSHGIPASHYGCRCVVANVHVEITFCTFYERDGDQWRITGRHNAVSRVSGVEITRVTKV